MSTATPDGQPPTPDANPKPAGEPPPAPVADPAAPPKAGDPPAPAAPSNTEVPPGEPKPAGEPPAPPAGAPEKYALQFPDGWEPAESASFEEMARGYNLTNEAAQKVLADLPATISARADSYLTETKAHAEIGGDKLAGAEADALKALNHFLPADSPEGARYRRAMNASGYGNWLPNLLAWARVGKAMGEDGGLGAVPPSSGPKTHAEAIWPGGGKE